ASAVAPTGASPQTECRALLGPCLARGAQRQCEPAATKKGKTLPARSPLRGSGPTEGFSVKRRCGSDLEKVLRLSAVLACDLRYATAGLRSPLLGSPFRRRGVATAQGVVHAVLSTLQPRAGGLET